MRIKKEVGKKGRKKIYFNVKDNVSALKRLRLK
jgi:hypothetical protein